jgi:uncharacterized protein YndB with AHSA1/START domain
MPTISESVEIARSPEQVWRPLSEPERWLEGYVRTRVRSPEYPEQDARNDFVFHTRMDEEVSAQVVRSEAPTLLEERQAGRTFERDVRYRLASANGATRVSIEDEVTFKGLAKLAAPIAVRDIQRRWRRSLERLREAAEAETSPGPAGTA